MPGFASASLIHLSVGFAPTAALTPVSVPTFVSASVASLQMVGSVVDDIVRIAGFRFLGVLAILLPGLVSAYVAGTLAHRLLVSVGAPGAIKGTMFERIARGFDTSTVEILSWLTRYFVLGISISTTLSFAGVNYADRFWGLAIIILPQLFIAIPVLITGVVVGDKVELLIAERPHAVKLLQVNILPVLTKHTVFFLATPIALSQVRIAMLTLIVLLGAYLLELIVPGAIAFCDLLRSGAAETYLLSTQPYSIDGEIVVGEIRGVVQELDMFVTHVESEDTEFVIPGARVLDKSVGRVRQALGPGVTVVIRTDPVWFGAGPVVVASRTTHCDDRLRSVSLVVGHGSREHADDRLSRGHVTRDKRVRRDLRAFTDADARWDGRLRAYHSALADDGLAGPVLVL